MTLLTFSCSGNVPSGKYQLIKIFNSEAIISDDYFDILELIFISQLLEISMNNLFIVLNSKS